MTAPTASPARMSASASLLTGKNRRRALQALIAAPLLALGIAAGSGTAHAVTGIFAPGEVRLADGHCAVSGWPHGEILCKTSVGANFPNHTQEIFGIGLDGAMWTDWGRKQARAAGSRWALRPISDSLKVPGPFSPTPTTGATA